MKVAWIEARTTYDGSQLRPHWIRRATGIVGDALVAFRGPCRLAREEIADLADVDGPGIAGDDMVHFIWEIFDDGDLVRAVLRQRLLAATALEVLTGSAAGSALRRQGDDLFARDRKLTISVATRSLVSTLIHFAANVTEAGTPVPTTSLVRLGVDPEVFARAVLDATLREHQSMTDARCQVRPRDERGDATA